MTGLSADPRRQPASDRAGPAEAAVHQIQADSALETLAKNGKSFYWASRLLGRRMAVDAAELYSFCRLLDDIADGDAPGGANRLNAVRSQLVILKERGQPAVMDPALAAYLAVMRRCAIPVAPLIHLLDGLLLDQDPMLVKDEDELVRYAYHVAGAVGLLMCPVLGCRDRAAFRFAVDMGIGMQLTNIARDILEDAHLGRRYLPESWAGPLSPKQIIASASAPDTAAYKAVQASAGRLLGLADRYYESGRDGLAFLPVRARAGIAVAGEVYRRIGVRLRKRDLRWGDGRVVTSVPEKLDASISALASLKTGAARNKQAVHDNHLHQPIADLMDEALR